MLWKYFTGFLIVVVILLAFLPPLTGSFDDVVYFSRIDSTKFVPVKAKIIAIEDRKTEKGQELYSIIDHFGNKGSAYFSIGSVSEDALNKYRIYEMNLKKGDANLNIRGVKGPDFIMTFPFLPGLEERARIILFHVPVAWVSVLAFLVSMVFSVRYLMKKNNEDDEKAVASAGLGLLFCILATITGSIWAKFNWGSFWNWDPRETSIFVLLLIYGAYFALRSAVEIEEKRATLSSIYSILAFITVPFFIFIMPRITSGLHPGSADDISSPGGGPIVAKSGMNFEMRIVFFLSLIAFTLLFLWLFHLKYRLSKIETKSNYL